MYDCHVHLVFVTKYRRGALNDRLLTRCEQVMSDVCDDFGCSLEEFNGEDDHVHLMVRFPPTVTLSHLVNSLKGVSARRLRQEFPRHVRRYLWGGHFWSRSYYIGTCGGAPLEVLARYIAAQRRPDATSDSPPA